MEELDFYLTHGFDIWSHLGREWESGRREVSM